MAKKKAAVKPARSKKTDKNPSESPKVRVRMFRQGLGDCFFLTFDVDGDQQHVLIDCGTLGSSAPDPEKVSAKEIGEHILKLLGSKGKLRAVIATHEHQDHLSGFNNAKMKELAGKVEQVWLAWTENPADPDAQKYATNKNDLGKSLALVAQAAPDSDVGRQIKDLLGFAGDVDELPEGQLFGATKFAKTVNEAMEFVRTGMDAKVVYHNPGDVIEEALPGFRVYVLGPPRTEAFMQRMGEHGSEELYKAAIGLQAAALAQLGAAHQSTHQLSPEDGALCELERPFDSRYNIRNTPREMQFYEDYRKAGNEWRSIEGAWQSLASHFALQLDSLTNNSSLALAFERIADGKVLLFPADAQEGNWLSWHDENLKFKLNSGVEVTAADLLARTVFYKVGHHASHNATARGKGLELMKSSDELVAFISVDRAIALGRNPQGSWKMPARGLYRRLLEKCQGRVMRSDLGWADEPSTPTEQEFDKLATKEEWTEWKKSQTRSKHVTLTPQYCEYVLD